MSWRSTQYNLLCYQPACFLAAALKHVPYLIFIGPGTVVPNSSDTVLIISIRKTKLKTCEEKKDKWLYMNSINTCMWSGHRRPS